MKKQITLLVLIVISNSLFVMAQEAKKNYKDLPWKQVATRMPESWYGTDESKMAADSILKYQTSYGGWTKNTNFHRGGIKQSEWKRIKETGIGATFDNSATTTEMMFLAKMHEKTKDMRYKNAFLKALNYIYVSQYDNGGWPQFYPYRIGNTVNYASHITYNDGAMVNVMNLLKLIYTNNSAFQSLELSPELKLKAKNSFEKGISCILKTQIKVDGKLTIWCAQHDEKTLAPAKARAYELASFSGGESVGIVQLLMDIDNPSKQIIDAVKSAVNWFEKNKITGIRLQEVINNEGKKDQVVIEDKNAPAIWARFYDLETTKPYFSDRDGIKRESIAEIGYERRNGYGWYTYAPQKLINNYEKWLKKNGI